MTDFSHMNAIEARISHEKARLALARNEHESAFRLREIAAGERELAAEYRFLGIEPATLDTIMSDDELLAALTV